MTATIQASNLRLVWAPPSPEQRIRGIWWPRSRNIAVELAGLLPAADEYLGAPLARVLLNADSWDSQPRRLYAGDRMIRIAWFTTIDPATVGLSATPMTMITLCLIPPDCPEPSGEDILAKLREEPAWPTEPSEFFSPS